MRIKPAALIILSITMALSGCGRNDRNSDLNKYLVDLKEKVANNKKESLLQKTEFPAPVLYQAKTMRTPFQSIGSVSSGDGKVLTDKPLQAYPLNALRFLGTIEQGDEMLAVMQTPDNIVYQVKIGEVIGKQYGKIINIFPDRIEVMEKPLEGNAPGTGRIVTLQLKDSS